MNTGSSAWASFTSLNNVKLTFTSSFLTKVALSIHRLIKNSYSMKFGRRFNRWYKVTECGRTSPQKTCFFLHRNEFLQVIIIMLLKGLACFLFLHPQDEVGPLISSSVVLCSFVLLVYIVVLVLVVCLCPSSIHIVAPFSGTVLFPLLIPTSIFHIFLTSLGQTVYRTSSRNAVKQLWVLWISFQ